MSKKPTKKRSRRANVTIEEVNLIPAILEQLEKLLVEEIYVGVFGDAQMAKIAAYQEYGAPKAGIPERSFLRAGMEKHKAAVSKIVRNELKSVVELQGDVGEMMNLVGQSAADKVKKYFEKLNDPPLKPQTIARKKDRNPKPLVNTGDIRDAIGFEVKPKG
ncbi:hypothetical protein JNUCC42_13235 [Brevibacterium sp. JNUCC-42]|nr:hypothetical protein JNUCC42_13235 [Brevibacterium sp. JNUCC-42]